MRLLAALAGLGLAAALAACPAAATPEDSRPQLRRDGQWLVDERGRVVLLHGVNAVWKLAPYVAPDTAEGFTAADADFLAESGFNTVRVGVIFAGVMPTRGVVDQGYLDRVERIVDLLAERHIWVLLDFHQDMYHPRFGGEGFPDWATYDDGVPLPVDAGFPGNYLQPATSRAFDNFWANRDGVQDLYAEAWRAVAERFRDQPYLMGYDVMNEPWAGTSYPSCVSPQGCPVFDTQLLQPFHAKVLAAIRSVDPANLVWIEPQVTFDFGAADNQGLLAGFGDPQLGLSWHTYCLPASLTHANGGQAGPECDVLHERVFDNATAAAQRLSAGQLITEFGASDDLPDVEKVTALADARLVGWQYWHYKEWHDPTTESGTSGGQGMFTDDADLSTLKQDKADLLIRPYARAVAGVPTAMRFDPGTGEFTLSYDARPAAGLTEVFLPARHFPAGYAVTVTGAHVASPPDASVLLLAADGPGRVSLRVSRR